MTRVLAWHWLPADRRLAYGNGREVTPGSRVMIRGPLILCERGLHASEGLLDSLGFAPGPVCCRVVLSGRVERGDDKLCASVRRVLWMYDATRELHEWACACARDVVYLCDDPRSLAAIETAERHIRGGATGAKLAAARDAARAASRDASCAAAGAAARAAARAAAGAAARAAAGAAARAAAWDAARAAASAAADAAAWAAACAAAGAAARDAARDAAWGAAWAAARCRYSSDLEHRIRAAAGRPGPETQ